jgi:hypothetical protein
MARPPLVLAVLACGIAAAAQELPSGPAPGTMLTPVRVYAPLGPRRGQEYDAAADLVTGPGALLFVHEISRNVAPLIRGFARLSDEFALLGLRTAMVRVADDRTAEEEHAARVSRALQLAQPIVVGLDGADGPGNYALNRKCTLTLVLTKDGRAHRSVGFTDTGAQDVPRLRAWIEEIAGVLPEDDAALRELLAARLPQDPAALRARAAELALEAHRLRERLARAESAQPAAERARMRAARERAAESGEPATPPAAAREGKAPQDTELRSLLRRFIRKDNDARAVAEVFAAIEQRVGDDAGLRQQAIDMFRLMLSLDYGSDAARERARGYLQAHARER